jgi:UDP-N-acetylmuramate dehydrogenase
MALYTTLRVGGPAEVLYEAFSLEELREVIVFLNQESVPYLIVGRGSNLLVKDSGLKGVAIVLRGSLAEIVPEKSQSSSILCGAGLSLVDLLHFCQREGFSGLEFLAGIPGSLGGAVAMNAGAFGHAIGTEVDEVQGLMPKGDLISWDRSQLSFSYRSMAMEVGFVIVRVRLRGDRADSGAVAFRIADYLKRRKATQSEHYPSAGSVFKNPPEDFAGKLIDKVGLKGKRIGGAMISEVHANYIVNTGDAKAEDILALLHLAQEKVREETGILLEPEVHIVGE